jgi:hypothetical protein
MPTPLIPELKIGMPYQGYVIQVENAVYQLPVKNTGETITYCHRLVMEFDAYPAIPVECQFCNTEKDSDLFQPGEYVKVFIKNFKKNYTVKKDTDFVCEKKIEVQEQVTAAGPIVSGDVRLTLITASLQAAATFSQYRPDIKKEEFYNIADELFNKAALQYEKAF